MMDMTRILTGDYYKHHKVMITAPSGAPGEPILTSVLSTETFDIGMGSNWDGDSGGSMMGKALETMGSSAALLAQTAGGTITSQNTATTIATWGGSDVQKFTLSLVFGLGTSVGAMDAYRTMIGWTYPELSGAGIMGVELFKPPAGFNATKALKSANPGLAEGLFTVRIGDWFEAKNVIVESCSPKIQTIFDDSGAPVLVQADVTFRAFRLLSADEFQQWFIK